MSLWRNGSASDSRSEGCVFKSRQAHEAFLYRILYLVKVAFLVKLIVCDCSRNDKFQNDDRNDILGMLPVRMLSFVFAQFYI